MLIGVASLYPQVGKSEVVNHLKRKHGFINTEMSDAISIIAEKFFGYNGDKSDPAQRKILQDLGLMGKGLYPTMWFYHSLGLARRRKWGLSTDSLVSPSFLFHYNLQPIMEEIKEKGIDKFMEGANVVIGGVRSSGEADEILKIGGKVILVIKDEKELIDSIRENHKVESQLKGYGKFSKVIVNNGTLEDLYNTVDKMLEKGFE